MKLLSFAAKYLSEIIVICLLIFAFQSYLGFSEERIRSDGIGYYDYLPSIFIRGDFVRKDALKTEHPQMYQRFMNTNNYLELKEHVIVKYNCGTALMISPFFLGNYVNQKFHGISISGYESSFNFTVFLSALFYLFFTLFFLKRILLLYNIDYFSIFLAQAFLVLATSVTYYTNHEATFSHIYSLCAISCFIYLLKAYFSIQKFTTLLYASAVFGLIYLIRPINILIVLFIPFLAGSFQNLKSALTPIFKSRKAIIYILFIPCAMVFLQCFLWYLQSGSFVVDSYKNEGFNFMHPEMLNILFSYKKGLFVYTPILFISLGGLIRYFLQRKYYEVFNWLFFFAVLTYFLSSWYSWYYSCSYGLRAYIEFYPVFFILFAVLINDLKLYFKIPILLISFFCIALNLVQTLQYQTYILHWVEMDKEKYWTVFMRTSDRYKGLVWKKKFYPDAFNPFEHFKLNDIQMEPFSGKFIFKLNAKIYPKMKDLGMIKIYITNAYSEKEKSSVIVSIKDTLHQKSIYYISIPLIQFQEVGLNKYQRGFYALDTPVLENTENLELSVFFNSAFNKIKFEDVNIILLKRKD